LAHKFLHSKAEWSLWVDSDVFMPFGNAAAFRFFSQSTPKEPPKFAEYNTVERLLSHKQPLVGGVYGARNKRGPLIIQPEIAPRGPNDRRIADAIREGKSAGNLQPVDWLATGLMLVHRTVFEKIRAEQPQAHAPIYPFFDRFDFRGEDQAFCQRARKAGFQPMLDTEIRAGHIGLAIFNAEDTVAPVPLGGR
jgi:hypothetical protein